MLTDLELMDIHVRALFTHTSESRLLFINEPDGAAAPAPRMFLGRTRAGNVWRFHADLPEELIEELDSLCADEPSLKNDFSEVPRNVERYLQTLELQSPVQSVSSGPAYCFPENG